jgi:hypothetical protein
MMNSTSSASGSKRRKKEVKASRGGLALGYEVLEIRDEGDEGGSLAGHDWLAVGLGVMLTCHRVGTSFIGLLPAFVSQELYKTCPDCSTSEIAQRRFVCQV